MVRAFAHIETQLAVLGEGNFGLLREGVAELLRSGSQSCRHRRESVPMAVVDPKVLASLESRHPTTCAPSLQRNLSTSALLAAGGRSRQ